MNLFSLIVLEDKFTKFLKGLPFIILTVLKFPMAHRSNIYYGSLG